MILSTLCYITTDKGWLLLHRTKKKNDTNGGKWIGVGGKLEKGESPEDCLLREVREETGLVLRSYRFRGIVTFCSDIYEDEIMFLFTSDAADGTLCDCDEGELAFAGEGELDALPMWEGDRIFLDLLRSEHPFFSLKLVYRGEALVRAVLDGDDMEYCAK